MLQNNKVKSLFFVFSNIVSQKMLKSKIKINESNTLLDIDNKIMDCYPSVEKSEYAVTANDLKNKSDIPILLFLSCTGYQ